MILRRFTLKVLLLSLSRVSGGDPGGWWIILLMILSFPRKRG